MWEHNRAILVIGAQLRETAFVILSKRELYRDLWGDFEKLMAMCNAPRLIANLPKARLRARVPGAKGGLNQSWSEGVLPNPV